MHICVKTDSATQKRGKATIRADEREGENLRNISLQIETLPLGCIIWDLAFHATTWNRAAERIFGYTSEEAMGKSPELLLPEGADNQMLSTWKGLLEGY